MTDKRPKNLNLLTIHFPIPAIVSILHRISGFILFLMLPLILWGFDLSLRSMNDFETVRDFLLNPLVKFLLWGGLSAFAMHFVAGIRHLLMDVHVGESLQKGRLTAWITCAVSIILIVLLGIWLW